MLKTVITTSSAHSVSISKADVAATESWQQLSNHAVKADVGNGVLLPDPSCCAP